ncbi:MAG: TfuA-like protein [Kofleriaceae bacterium]
MSVGRGTVVFVGPSLPAAEVRARLPGAVVAPPAAAGDILRWATQARPPRRLALIDGFFERMAAPWHKELLYALERGLEVYGAASMGALRAAELDRFGMIGVGRVYRGYATGAIVADDEVGGARAGGARLRRRAWRWSTCGSRSRPRPGAARSPRSTPTACSRRLAACSTASAITPRSWRRRARRACRRARWRAGAAIPDAKAADARALVRRLATRPPAARAARAAVRVERTWALGVFADALGVRLR